MTTAKKSDKTTTAAKAKSTISKDGTITCTGTCGETLPETKFPTMRNAEGEYVRRDECRACQASRRAATRDAKAKAAKK